jgi:hypothetical protein
LLQHTRLISELDPRQLLAPASFVRRKDAALDAAHLDLDRNAPPGAPREQAQLFLEQAGFEVYLPRVRCRTSRTRATKTAPLFPGYVFVRIEQFGRLVPGSQTR